MELNLKVGETNAFQREGMAHAKALWQNEVCLFEELQADPMVGVQKAWVLTVHCEARPLRTLCIGGLAEDLAIFSPKSDGNC